MLHRTAIFALEGIGGCGKSHSARLISEQLRRFGYTADVFKIAGLGDSPRVQQLKAIMQMQRKDICAQVATPKQQNAAQQERIFRLAMKYQIRQFLHVMKTSDLQIAVLDRIPLMIWVYAASRDSDNPYLDDILD